jgi:hypothetical protein
MTKVTNEELKNQTVPKRCDRDAILTLSISTLARRGYGSTAQLRAKRIPARFRCRFFVPSCSYLLPRSLQPRLVYSACRQIPPTLKPPPLRPTAISRGELIEALLYILWLKLCSPPPFSRTRRDLSPLRGSPLSRPPPGPVGIVADAWVFILRIAGRN